MPTQPTSVWSYSHMKTFEKVDFNHYQSGDTPKKSRPPPWISVLTWYRPKKMPLCSRLPSILEVLQTCMLFCSISKLYKIILIHTHTHTHNYAHTHTHTRTHASINTHTHTHTHAHTHTHTHTHIHTYTHYTSLTSYFFPFRFLIGA